jgi:hypothetical protein
MTDEEQQPAALSNLERLQEHLAKDSLGGMLVAAAMAADDAPCCPRCDKSLPTGWRR